MNVKVVTDFDVEGFQTLFPEATVLTQQDILNREKIDLLIFPGGADVTLEWYLDEDDVRRFAPLCGTDKSRDIWEKRVLAFCFDGTMDVNKILGVCRGIQFLNVMFGGVLFPDLPTYDLAHPRMHPIRHRNASNLSFFQSVNSTHHQGVRIIGDYYRDLGLRTNPKMIATDYAGSVVEIATWFNDKVLGIQFHPEYYSDSNPDKIAFVEFLREWIAGEKTILK